MYGQTSFLTKVGHIAIRTQDEQAYVPLIRFSRIAL